MRPHGPLRAPKLHAWAARRRAKEPVPKSGATGKDAPAAHEERKPSRVSLPPRAPREGFRWAGGAHSKTTAKACALGTHAGAVATYRGERALQTARNWAAAGHAPAPPPTRACCVALRRCAAARWRKWLGSILISWGRRHTLSRSGDTQRPAVPATQAESSDRPPVRECSSYLGFPATPLPARLPRSQRSGRIAFQKNPPRPRVPP